MIKIEQLIKTGLKPKQAKIYFTLLHDGPQFLQQISKKTGIKRTTLYPIIEKMIDEKIVGVEIKQKRKFYFAQNPEELLFQVREQKNLLEALMPQLKNLFDKTEAGSQIQVYDTEGGLKKMLEQINTVDPQKTELLTIESMVESAWKWGFEFWKELLAKKKKLGIASRTIIPSSQKENFVLKEHKIKIRTNNNIANFNIMLYLFDNKTYIIIPNQTLCIVLENQKIKAALTDLFEIVWKRSKPWHESQG